MEELLEQILNKRFKPLRFSMYNEMEMSGDLSELEGIFKTKLSIDDFEYQYIEISERDKNAIKYRVSLGMEKFNMLKRFIEKDIQEDRKKPKSKLLINKDDGIVLLVKFVGFDLKEAVREEINEEPL